MKQDCVKKRSFALRLNDTMKSDVRKIAKELNISENALINLAINDYLKSRAV